MPITPTVHLVESGLAPLALPEAWARRLPWPLRRHASGRDFLNAWHPGADEAACLVCELRLPTMTGLELQRRLAARDAETPPILLLAGRDDAVLGLEAMRAGAADVLLRPVDGERLRERVCRAVQHHLARRRSRHCRRVMRERLARLTAREHEVLEHVVDGATSKAIAARLGISPKTVELHRAHIMTKFEVGSLAALVRGWMLCEAP
ncbi:response regulator transcription factor [Modicisalibacter tunisiensis]|uniref:Response regulator transcription factor n=1 Tax=Modicisalibacter tunisiensis TaxID=390637 RepID=A0ABS7WXU4_9GAMM|nr:LuxR C-terminal-related transcriptional regulator [Modicisalibacter tunisiensis]MBZ9567038.1 response regulator transcription factor [Modicisalibacter tunisiensis]